MEYRPPERGSKGGFKRELSTGEWIKEYLLENGSDYIQNIWREFKRWCNERGYTPPAYQSFRSNHINMLKKLDLIRFVREEESDFGEPRRYYTVNHHLTDHRGWRNPRKVLDSLKSE